MCWQSAEQLAIGAWCIDGAQPLTEGGQAMARKSCAGNLRNCGDAVHISYWHASEWCDAWQKNKFLDPVESSLHVVGLGTTAE